MKSKQISLAKLEQNALNEDAVLLRSCTIAVSDGAGGGGLYADEWAKYLLACLPAYPIASSQVLDDWIDGIWEEFYNTMVQRARETGSLHLEKFYDEGAFATLACLWRTSRNTAQWMAYGDSVVFCYNRRNDLLKHSFTQLTDFALPPYLINCKDELQHQGFHYGEWQLQKGDILFVASDALAHYVLMGYMLTHKKKYRNELQAAITQQNKNANYVRAAQKTNVRHFYRDVLRPLLQATNSDIGFRQYIYSLRGKKVIAHDDYSCVVLSPKWQTKI